MPRDVGEERVAGEIKTDRLDIADRLNKVDFPVPRNRL